MKMRAAVFATLIVGVGVGASQSAFADHGADFTIHNDTGAAITSLFVSEAADNEWGGDILGKDALANGESTLITFSGNASACKFDIKLEEKGGKLWVVPGIDLCEIHKLKFSKKGGKVVFEKEMVEE